MESEKQLIEDLQELAEELGKTPTVREMDEYGECTFSSATYRKYFDSWNNAIREAGLQKNQRTNISKKELIEDLQELAEELGKPPTIREMDEHGTFSKVTYRKYFDSWNNALDEAGLEINCLGSEERAGTGEEAYGAGYNKVRQKCYERDNHQCRACEIDSVIHCHHIKPRRTFGNVSDSNTLDNVITLCNSCHGKFEGKWQEATPKEFAELAQKKISTEAKPLSIDSNNTELEQ